MASPVSTLSPLRYYLCVDGGGSSCTAVLLSSSGIASVGEAGPCNVSTLGIEAAISVVSSAIASASSSHAEVKSDALESIPIYSAWVGLAGYDRPLLAPSIDSAISNLLRIPFGSRLTISTDIDLLSVKAKSQPLVKSAIVLVAGTGSIAMSYVHKAGRMVRSSRMGGWGPLLGDEGSGYAIGREALRIALRTNDLTTAGGYRNELPALTKAVHAEYKRAFEDFQPRDLLSFIVAPPTTVVPETASGGQSVSSTPTKVIAQAAKIVVALHDDDQARSILQRGAASLCELVADLLLSQKMQPTSTGLIMAGGLLNSSVYSNMVQGELRRRAIEFKWISKVESPASEGARFLASEDAEIGDPP